MCYGAQIAAKARTVATKTGMPYDEAFKIIEGEYSRRWTTAFGRPGVPILRGGGDAVLARWTLLPPRIKDEKEAAAQTARTGNARAEEMYDKPTFKQAARHRRCVLAFEAYYEHQHRGKVKVPYRFHRPDGGVFFVGGIWQDWHGEPTFAVCTMRPNRLAAWIHNNPDALAGPRQPVVLRNDDEVQLWLAGGEPESLAPLLEVREDGFLVAQETRNISGVWVENSPPPPPGAPEGVEPPEKGELF
jgi:putative SOS response-associated peptidase YedK